jgi:outer membrane protein assembly factor BamB
MFGRTVRRQASVTVLAVAMVGFVATAGWMSPAVAGSGFTGTGDWPMMGDGPAHNSVNRAERTLSPSTVSGLKVLHTYGNWSASSDYWRIPLVVGSTGYGGAVSAFSLPSGVQMWSRQVYLNSNNWNYVPAISNGVLYVGGDHAMWAINATTGAKIWHSAYIPNSPPLGLAPEFNPTTVAGSIVYADTFYGETIYAFDTATGRVLWTAPVRWMPRTQSCARGGYECVIWPVSVANGLAYVVSDHLTAYNASTGALVFSSPVKVIGSYPAVSNGMAFISSSDGLHAFNATTGQLIWSNPDTASPKGPESTAPAVDGSTVVVGTPNSVMAFAASDGHRLWTTKPASSTVFYTTPSIANGVVYAGGITGFDFQAINEATGAVLFTGNASYGAPTVSNGSVYVPGVGTMDQYGL